MSSIQEIKDEIKDIRIKVESIINILIDGKTIVTYQKLLGVRDKLNRLAHMINNLNKNSQ